ncbi:MAG: hypothetical protein H0U35_04575 [Sporichthyaceae bacterium]|nr:hypothetical protein [Sporichthyaceae bacterium]
MTATCTSMMSHQVQHGIWHAMTTHVSSGDVATVLAAVMAACVAAFFAISAYKKQEGDKRRDERATLYAEALRAIEDYCEAPYRIRRKDGSREITQHISGVKSRISFYSGWLTIHAPEPVRSAYEKYVQAAQREAGAQMTQAWHAQPTKRDRDVPLGRRLPQPATAVARNRVLDAMRADLQE